MQMLYNSDSFVIVEFDVPVREDAGVASADAGLPRPQLSRGGYEIVDKFARKEIFIDGALAQSFKEAVQAQIQDDPSEEAMDAFIGRYASLMHNPLVYH